MMIDDTRREMQPLLRPEIEVKPIFTADERKQLGMPPPKPLPPPKPSLSKRQRMALMQRATKEWKARLPDTISAYLP